MAMVLTVGCWKVQWLPDRAIRVSAGVVVACMCLLASFYEFNFLVGRAHNADRALVLLLGAGCSQKPALLFCFVPLVMLMTTQWGLHPAEWTNSWYFIKWGCCSSFLTALAADVLFRRLGGRAGSTVVCRLLHVLLAMHYFNPGVIKIRENWAEQHEVHTWAYLWHFLTAGDFVWGTRSASPVLFDALESMTEYFDREIRLGVPLIQVGGALVLACSPGGWLTGMKVGLEFGFHFVIGFACGDVFWGHAITCGVVAAIAMSRPRQPSCVGLILLVGHTLPVLTAQSGSPDNLVSAIFAHPWGRAAADRWPLTSSQAQRDHFLPGMAFHSSPASFRVRLEVETDAGNKWTLDPRAFAPFDMFFGRALFWPMHDLLVETPHWGLGECGASYVCGMHAMAIRRACAATDRGPELEREFTFVGSARCMPRAATMEQAPRAEKRAFMEGLISKLLFHLSTQTPPPLWWPWSLVEAFQRSQLRRWLPT
ncbi:unnamed protein product, partial [Polarella glacialis]